jgi:hypothetical protein
MCKITVTAKFCCTCLPGDATSGLLLARIPKLTRAAVSRKPLKQVSLGSGGAQPGTLDAAGLASVDQPVAWDSELCLTPDHVHYLEPNSTQRTLGSEAETNFRFVAQVRLGSITSKVTHRAGCSFDVSHARPGSRTRWPTPGWCLRSWRWELPAG